MSDLAQHLIKSFASKHSWSVESYPGRVKLPGDIVRPLPNAEAANEVSNSNELSVLSFTIIVDRQDCVSARVVSGIPQ